MKEITINLSESLTANLSSDEEENSEIELNLVDDYGIGDLVMQRKISMLIFAIVQTCSGELPLDFSFRSLASWRTIRMLTWGTCFLYWLWISLMLV